MKPYAYWGIPKEDLELFNKIKRIVQKIPEVDLGVDEEGKKILVSCHILARALANVFPVKYKSGYFVNRAYSHSWLVTKSGIIIDPYPWAMVGGPILIDTRFITPWSQLYQEINLSPPDDIDFLERVKKVTEIIRQTMAVLKIKA
jgi:hypothetical protein